MRTTQLNHYPSASTLEFYKNKLYIIGDDATQVLIVDRDHKLLDSITLFKSESYRLSKKDKPDIESSFIGQHSDQAYLIALGSFSTKKRNKIFWINLNDKTQRSTSMKLPRSGVKSLNIEGAVLINNQLVLSNRADRSNKENNLLVGSFDMNEGIGANELRKIKIDLPVAETVVGLSSISYFKDQDLLLFAASTESTSNSTSDGPIGDSYIGYIKNFSAKLNASSLTPDKMINLNEYLASANPQKIESIAAESAQAKELTIHLASDNDDGKSTLYKLKWKME